jgi:hypothetical protein
MKSEITEFNRTFGVSSSKESPATRTWSMGQRTSRTDAPMVSVLSVDSVDAVFNEESLSFVENFAQLHEKAASPTQPGAIVESLASQLAVLESQCVSLRRMLEVAAIGV